MRRLLWSGWIAAALAVGGAGCGAFSGPSGVSGSSQEATVSGVVRLRGKPVDNGAVTFRVANVNRPDALPREAPIGKDGSYTITTLVGDNNVEVSSKELRKARNARFGEDEHFIMVQSGENVFDIDIPPQASPTSP